MEAIEAFRYSHLHALLESKQASVRKFEVIWATRKISSDLLGYVAQISENGYIKSYRLFRTLFLAEDTQNIIGDYAYYRDDFRILRMTVKNKLPFVHFNYLILRDYLLKHRKLTHILGEWASATSKGNL